MFGLRLAAQSGDSRCSKDGSPRTTSRGLAGNSTTWIALAALVYLVTPFDAVPDFTPILGLLDDVSVILYAVAQLGDLLKETNRKAAEEKAEVEINKH